MTLGIVGITAAYVLLAVLLLSINLYSKWSWPVKAGTIILTSMFYLVTYMSFPPLLGWPTKQNPTRQFRLIAAHVEQADKQTGDDGAIYLWLSHIENMSATSPPRAYQLPYSDALHEKIINANAKLNKAIPQLGEFKEPDENMLELEDDSRMIQISTQIEFYDMPDPLFPDK